MTMTAFEKTLADVMAYLAESAQYKNAHGTFCPCGSAVRRCDKRDIPCRGREARALIMRLAGHGATMTAAKAARVDDAAAEAQGPAPVNVVQVQTTDVDVSALRPETLRAMLEFRLMRAEALAAENAHIRKLLIERARKSAIVADALVAGHSLDEAAAKAGYASRSGAWKAYRNSLENHPAESVEELRKKLLARADIHEGRRITTLEFRLMRAEALAGWEEEHLNYLDQL